MKKVLITGAGGFIGSHLTEELIKRGYYVTALVKYNSRSHFGFLENIGNVKNLNILLGDITDQRMINTLVKGKDVVFNLAALIGIPYSYFAPESYIKTNTMGTLNIANACLEQNILLIQTSTSEVYGTALYTPIDENHLLQAQSPYAASKIGADKVVESFINSFGLKAVTLRPFNTFGPRQSSRAFIPSVISQILSKNTEIKVGNLEPIRDLNFVSNIVDAFVLASEIEECKGLTLNVGSGIGFSMKEVFDKIVKLMNVEKKVIIKQDLDRIRPENSEVFNLICNSNKFRKITNWKPNIDLEEGIQKTIQYIIENINLYKTNTYNI
ncbi:MAG: SDR family NAD(P)-dependent oxidoreductase [Bacteroidota bacterium]